MNEKEKLIAKADVLLEKKQDKELRALLSSQDFHIAAQVIDGLTYGKRKTFALLPPEKQAEVALVLTEDSKRRIFPRLSDEMIARFLHFNDEDDATDEALLVALGSPPSPPDPPDPPAPLAPVPESPPVPAPPAPP